MAEGGSGFWSSIFDKINPKKKTQNTDHSEKRNLKNVPGEFRAKPKGDGLDEPDAKIVDTGSGGDGSPETSESNDGSEDSVMLDVEGVIIHTKDEYKELQLIKTRSSTPPAQTKKRTLESELKKIRQKPASASPFNFSTAIYSRRDQSVHNAGENITKVTEDDEHVTSPTMVQSPLFETDSYAEMLKGRSDTFRMSDTKMKMVNNMPWASHLFPSETSPRTSIKDISIEKLVYLGKTQQLNLHDEDVIDLRKLFLSMSVLQKREFYFCGEKYVIHEQIQNWQTMGEEMFKAQLTADTERLTSQGQIRVAQMINKKVAIWEGDISRLEVDAVVNSTSSILLDPRSGVSKSLCTNAGKLLEYELRTIWHTYVGEAVTTAGYCLPAKYILHTSGPPKDWKDWVKALKDCYWNSLEKMKELNIKTLAFCCIATGAKGVDSERAARIALETTHDWLKDNHEYVDKVIFCIYEKYHMKFYKKIIQEVFPIVPGSQETGSKLPPEILRMDRRSQELYVSALKVGETEVHSIRVMVVGHFGVGKSTLTKRLLGEDVDIDARESTDGIEVHVKQCRVDIDTGLWEVNTKGFHKDDSSARLANVIQHQLSMASSEGNSLSNYKPSESSDGENSLEIDSNKNASSFVASPSGYDSPDSKHVTFDQGLDESYESTEATGESVNTSLTSQNNSVMEDLKLLVRGNSEEMRDINKYADLSIWDFAGQYDFYGTHQMFLSPRCVYLLVIDLSKTIDSFVENDTGYVDGEGEKKMKISEFIEFWLQSIYFNTKVKKSVILVGTHAGDIPEAGRKKHVDEFFKKLRSHLSEKPFGKCLSNYQFAIDNKIVDGKLVDLKNAIFEVAKSKKSHWGERIPANWLTLERDINGMRQKGEKIIQSHKLEEENSTLCCPLSEEQLDLFLRFQHDCGLLLFFSDLGDYIVLDPQFLIDAFKCFITTDEFKEQDMDMLPLWTKFKKTCVLTKEFIDKSWEHSNDRRFWNHKDHLLRLMEKLDIIAKPATYPNDDSHQRKSQISEGDYLTPCMLKEKPPTSLLDTSESNSTHKLCYTFSNSETDLSTLDQISGFVPPAIFHRLLAACMSTWQPRVKKQKGEMKPQLFCGCGVFNLDASQMEALTLYLRDNYIQMWITSSGSYPNQEKCIATRNKIEGFLQKLCSNCSMNDITTFIKCPKTDCRSSEGMIQYKDFIDEQKYCCTIHEGQDHTICADDVLRYWQIRDGPESPVSFLDRVPTDREIAKMAYKISNEWQQVGLLLGLSHHVINRIHEDNSQTVNRICSMLIEWKNLCPNGVDSTFRTLKKALEDAGSNVKDVFESFSQD